MSIKDKKVGFLGSGNMGEAIIKGLLQTGLVPASSIAATDARADRLEQIAKQYGIRAATSNRALVAEADVVILAVKPQIMSAVLKDVAGVVDRGRLLISVAAGVPVAALREALGKPARLIRVMPNTPALVLEGVTAIARAEGLESGDLEMAQELFGAVGRVVVLEEDHLDAVTGLSGSGPAYVATRDRVTRRRRREDGAGPRHRDDPGQPDRPRLGQARPRDRNASGAAQGHGGFPRGYHHRRHRGAGRGGRAADIHQRRGARDAALA